MTHFDLVELAVQQELAIKIIDEIYRLRKSGKNEQDITFYIEDFLNQYVPREYHEKIEVDTPIRSIKDFKLMDHLKKNFQRLNFH